MTKFYIFWDLEKDSPGSIPPPDTAPDFRPRSGPPPEFRGRESGAEIGGGKKPGAIPAPDTAPDFRPRPGAAPGIPGAEIGGGKKPGAVRPRNSGGGFAFSAPGIRPRNSGGGLNAFPECSRRENETLSLVWTSRWRGLNQESRTHWSCARSSDWLRTIICRMCIN